MKGGSLSSPTRFVKLARLAFCFACASVFASSSFGQSTLQEFPTPVTANQIEGTIEARAIGDSRLTSYYYVLDANQGDVFINVVTENFAGDIDVFIANGLRPVSKIVLYADTPVNETGRVVYFRRTERLLLRVQGRTPNDDAARFSIKFAGSFASVDPADFPDAPELPVVRPRQTDARAATSAGTLIAQPMPEDIGDEEAESEIASLKRAGENTEDEKKTAEESLAAADLGIRQTPQVVVTENLEKPQTAEPISPIPAEVSVVDEDADEEVEAADQAREEQELPVTEPSPPAQLRGRPRVTDTDPTAGLSLVVVFRNGGTIRRPMPEVSRFQVDRGVLTIVGADGTVGRYSMAEVAKVTIE